MKRQQREMQEMVEREVSRQLNAKDAIDVGSLDEDVEELADEISKFEYKLKEFKYEFAGIKLMVSIFCMLVLAWAIYFIITSVS